MRKWLYSVGIICMVAALLTGCQTASSPAAEEKKLIAPTSPEWLYTHGPWKKVNEPEWGDVMKGWMNSTDRPQFGRRAAIETDSPFAILRQRAIGGTVTIFVDGKLAIEQLMSAKTKEIPIYSGSAGWHKIEVVFSDHSEIDGLYISPDAKVRQPEHNQKKLVVIGHSYIDGTGSSNRGLTSITPVLGDILGVESINQGIGRTDVDVPVPASAKNSGLDRVQTDIIQLKPDYVLSVYGFNARGMIPEQFQADYVTFLKTIQDALPATSVFASGMISVPSLSEESELTYNTAIKNACASVSNCTFIDLAGKWNEGNYSQYLSNDGVHPNDKGYRFLAEEYANVMSGVIKK
ncbi:SGNH/GDSL hydrolase family protein [Tumebacillus lipolyticus]|uniref:SGNH/GDSL hydrolase family protein n=1 Tax=Tumebacillus lipolyticus TaxID=1280370 RepID=A0ABW4ZWL7_9BACL